MAKKNDVQVEVQGAGDILGFFDDMGKIGSSEKFRQGMLDAAVVGESHVKTKLQELVYDTPLSLSYKRTGTLRRSTTASKGVEKGKGWIATAVAAAVDYAVHVEYGTEDKDGVTLMPARPFMQLGLEAGAKDILQVLSNAM